MPFKPGQSGNPGGRPKEAEGLAKYIREQSKDGKEFADKLMVIMNHAPECKDRINAIKVLLEYGFGKPKEQVEIVGDFSITTTVEEARRRVLGALGPVVEEKRFEP